MDGVVVVRVVVGWYLGEEEERRDKESVTVQISQGGK